MSAPKPSILLVDDDPAVRSQLMWQLSERFEVGQAGDKDSALAALQQRRFPVVLLDLHLTPAGNDRGGLDVLRYLARHAPRSRVVLLTGDPDPQMAREALRWGAWDFCAKPMEPERLRWILERAVRLMEIESAGVGDEVILERFGAQSTANPEMARVLRAAEELSTTRLPVLILGRAGCGKTLLAMEILQARLPEGAPVIVVPVGELPGEADISPHAGWILEQAESLSQAGQKRLEQLLDSSSIRPAQPERPPEALRGIGSRLLVTAREDLVRMARRGRYLPSLARRLETARLEIPSLALRGEDHALIVRAILGAWSRKVNRTAPRLTPEAESVLFSLIPKLEIAGLTDLVERAADRSEGVWIGADQLLVHSSEKTETLRSRRAQLDAAVLHEALARRLGNVSRTARDLGVSRPTLHDLLRKYELDPSRYRQS